MLDNEGLALTFELVGRRISPKAGIINGLEIPNSSNTGSRIAGAWGSGDDTATHLSLVVLTPCGTIVSNNDDNSGKMSGGRSIRTIIITDNNGTTSGGSHWSARGGASMRSETLGSRSGCRRAGGSADCEAGCIVERRPNGRSGCVGESKFLGRKVRQHLED